MRNPDDFDEFYKLSRDRLLLQTFALTGDLRASRSAVRDAYVLAWHHWRKVNRQADRESWVRVHAWADARARHNARIWHRDKTLDADSRATLEALARLTTQQRRVLVLTQLTSAPMPEIAREVGLPPADAEQVLQTAAASYTLHRGTPSSHLRAELTGLVAATGSARLPRASIVRRAGAARRRTFTLVGTVGSVVALAAAGSFVTDGSGQASSPHGALPDPGISLSADQLLDPAQLGTQLDTLGRGTWTATAGAANTAGDGLNTPCQAARFADPDGLGSLVRRFQLPAAKGRTTVTVVQSSELSRTARSAGTTYASTLGWYAGCMTPGVHLLRAYAVRGVGDAAQLLVLQGGAEQRDTYTVGVARTGQVTTSVFHLATRERTPPVQPVADLLGAAVDRLCGAPGAGGCAHHAVATQAPPPPVGTTPGLLDVVDLPRPGRVTQPWTATESRQARVNLATPACDKTRFDRAPVSHGVTRSYLILKAGLVDRFGITETVGTLPDSRRAAAFVDGVRKRMATCEDRFAASKVGRLADRHESGTQVSAWHITTQVGDQGAVDMLMAIVRRGPQVAQIGFVTARTATYDRATFLAVAQRAIERLAYLAAPRNS